MMYLPVLAVLFTLIVLPGAIAGVVMGARRGRSGAGLGYGVLGGGIGGILGVVFYLLYQSSLPYEIRQGEWGPYRHIFNPPPYYVQYLAVVGGSLLFAILSTMIFLYRPAGTIDAEKPVLNKETRSPDHE